MRGLILGVVLALACVSPALATCSFTSIGSLPFTYNPITGGAATASSTMTVSCDASSGTNVSISLDPGLHAGASSNPWRKLLNAANNQTLNYNIYTDGAYTTIWGDGTNATATQSHAQVAASFSFTLYGQVPSGQNVSAGNFSDTVTATMTF